MDDLRTFRQRVRAREVLFGMFLQLGSPVAAEIVGAAGFDWVLVDLEHGSGAEADLLAHLQALGGSSAAGLVRVESGARLRIGRALDAGAVGVMVPRVETAADAAEIVRLLRYPPDGIRGVALGTRSAGYGRRALTEIARMNDEVVGIIQIESPVSVEQVDEIAALEGVDVLFIGPADLSLALGVPGQLDHPLFQRALERILAAGTRHGKAVGTLLRNAQEVESAVQQGITFVGITSEAALLGAAVRGVVRDARAAVPAG